MDFSEDVKLSPDRHALYVADMRNNGVWERGMNPQLRVKRFLPTGVGAPGLYPSRDARVMYVSNRMAGTISVVSFATREVVTTWRLAAPASSDTGRVSADGRTLWLSGRYNMVVYAVNTRSGRLRAEIPVANGPRGLCVWPRPGRYSLGHPGILR